MTKIEKKIYDLAKQRAKNFYKTYKHLLKYNYMSYQDLEQECHLLALETYQKYKHLQITEIKKLFNSLINKRLITLFNKLVKHNNIFVDCSSITKLEEIVVDYKQSNFSFSELSVLCSPKEYQILVWKFKYGYTFEEIGIKLNCTKQWAETIYKKIIAKIQKKMGVKK